MPNKHTHTTDPATSHDTIEYVAYSTADEAVEEALSALGGAADFQIEAWVRKRTNRFSGQRLRTARKALEDEHIITYARDREGIPFYAITPSGHKAHVWRLV